MQEYLESSRWRRFSYRLRAIRSCCSSSRRCSCSCSVSVSPSSTASPRERHSVWWMNLALLGVAVLHELAVRLGAYLLLQTVAWMVAGAAGIWLFYVQHQFEDAYWERDEDWDYTAAALQGSSYLQAAADPAMVLRQHRVPPHPPPEPAHSQLQPGEVPRSRPDFPARPAHHPVHEPQVPAVSLLG